MNISDMNATHDDGDHSSSPRWLEVLTAVWLSCLLLLGVLINTGALVILIRSRIMASSNNVLIAALLINNLTMAVLGFPLPIVAEISGGWYINLTLTMCIYNAFIVYLCGLTSMFILTTISVTRYFVIVHFSTIGKSISAKTTLGIVILIYSGAMVLAVAPLLGLGSYGLEEHITSCGLAWNDRSYSNRIYLLVILFVNLGIPVFIMIYCYGSIYRMVRKAAIATEAQASRRFIAQKKREHHLVKMCVAMVVAFLVSWTPYAIVSFYQAFGPGTRLSPVITRIPAVVAKTSILWDPIIYAINNGSLRDQLRSLFGLARSESSDNTDTDHEVSSAASPSPVPEAQNPK